VENAENFGDLSDTGMQKKIFPERQMERLFGQRGVQPRRPKDVRKQRGQPIGVGWHAR
jgi:hypothetical protein